MAFPLAGLGALLTSPFQRESHQPIINPTMKIASFEFFAELLDLLPKRLGGGAFSYEFNGNQSVKHLIEALGIPHTEVGRILVNGSIVSDSYLVHSADQIEVHPARYEQQADEAPIASQLDFCFVLDNHLGKLAAYLRMLGLDSAYSNDYQDEQLVEIAIRDDRILLTRDRRLLMRKQVRAGYCIRSLEPVDQLKEVVRRFGLQRVVKPFRRCLRCNAVLEDVFKEKVLDRLEPLTRQYYETFSICPACQQIYWQGSHFIRMQQLIQEVLGTYE